MTVMNPPRRGPRSLAALRKESTSALPEVYFSLDTISAINAPLILTIADAKLSSTREADRSPALVFVTPSHQFPLGDVLSIKTKKSA
ncbi:MAG: hypothetical protein PHC45_00740 [Clostridiaceae bacterium]|nr:hypothetical protein [Clostridiaceae bacterium]